jgi:hypothetical protein
MRISSLQSIFGTTLTATALVLACGQGCAVKTATTDLGSAEELLVGDNQEVESVENDAEESSDEALSGALAADPGAEVDPAETDDALAERVKVNPGKFFQAGCLTTTAKSKGVFEHVLVNCIRNGGTRAISGTILATWTRPEPGKMQVVRAATGLKVGNATIDRTVTVVYSREGSKLVRNRTVAMTGTGGGGKPISRDASWVTSYDAATKCIERAGSSVSKHAGRELSATVVGYKRCGVFSLGCPESGKITLNRKKGVGEAAQELTIVLEFKGGKQLDITLPDGSVRSRALICRA